MPLGLPGRDFSIALQPHGSKMALFGRAWFFVFDEASGDICEIDLGIGREGFNSVLQAEWSPDGQYIALIITGYAPRQILQYSVVMVIDFKTGKQETIPLDSPFVYEISWSNNNQFLAIMGADINVHGNISSRSRIYVADILKDKNPTLISDQLFGGGATDGWLLKWSPDGSEIATKCPTWSTSEPLITEDKICLIDVTKNP